jgi:iron complex transport system ATP-binding protein
VVVAPLLEARGVAHEYPGGVRALAGVDLALAAGELLVVIGPNGSGKSTLLRALAGLLVPSSGAVSVGGVAVRALEPRERARRVAVVPQFLPSLPEVTVEAFALGGRYAWLRPWRGPQRLDLERTHAALEACDAGDLAGRVMGELSGGQRQRVLVARALAQEARAVLVDEPTNSLDPEHQVRTFELLARLACDGRGALVVTHDLNLASQFADRIALLDEGRIVAEGSPQSVLAREVLEPVYGRHLHYGSLPAASGSARPFVLPWRSG